MIDVNELVVFLGQPTTRFRRVSCHARADPASQSRAAQPQFCRDCESLAPAYRDADVLCKIRLVLYLVVHVESTFLLLGYEPHLPRAGGATRNHDPGDRASSTRASWSVTRETKGGTGA